MIIVESKEHFNLKDYIGAAHEQSQTLFEFENDSFIIDVLSQIVANLSLFHLNHIPYQRLIPQNIFIASFTDGIISNGDENEVKILFKFPFWLLLKRFVGNDQNCMFINNLLIFNDENINFETQYPYYLHPSYLLQLSYAQSQHANGNNNYKNKEYILLRENHNLIKQKCYKESKIQLRFDLWSLGCCIAEMFYSLPLFGSCSITDQFAKIFQV